MNDRHGQPLHVNARVRWGSCDRRVYGTVRAIRPNPYKPGAEECCADNGNPANDDYKTNGWTALATLTSREVTYVGKGMNEAEKEAHERAELARLMGKYVAKEGEK